MIRDLFKYWGKKKGFYAFWILLVIFMNIGAQQAPINIDEVLHYDHAKEVVDWYATGGENDACLNTPKSNLKYYGQSVDNISALVNRIFNIENEYKTRHIIGWMIASLLLLIIGLIAFEVSGKWMVAMLAMFLMYISPRPMGQAFNNLKDIPFALGYAWSILIMIRIFKSFPDLKWKYTLQLALALAFSNSLRIGGMVLVPYLGVFVLAGLMNDPTIARDVKFWKNWLIKGFVMVFIGYFGSLIFWPFGLQNPLEHPYEALQVMEHYKISIRQIFEGEFYWSTALPWYYLPKWMLISIPEVVILGLIAWLMVAFKKGMNFFLKTKWLILWFTFLFPMVYVVIIDSNLYSGWRQMYFIYVPLVVLAANGLYEFVSTVQNQSTRRIQVAMFALLCLSPFLSNPLTFSNDYVYFNSLSGGNSKTWSNYEYDYYWNDIQTAVEYFQDEIAEQGKNYTIASNFLIEPYFYENDNYHFEFISLNERNSVEFDYGIFGVNFVHPFRLKHGTWRPSGILKAFDHKGNPTAIVIESNNEDALLGFEAFNAGDYNFALSYFNKALSLDKNDINSLSYMAKCVLNSNDFTKFEALYQKSLEIQPFYEPMMLLNAEKYHRKGEYEKAILELEELLKVNSRYRNALPILIDCYERSGQIDKAQMVKNKLN